MTACAKTAGPIAVDRITSDPLWGVSTTVRVWVGTTSPEAVLVEMAPECRTAVEAALPFLRDRAA